MTWQGSSCWPLLCRLSRDTSASGWLWSFADLKVLWFKYLEKADLCSISAGCVRWGCDGGMSRGKGVCMREKVREVVTYEMGNSSGHHAETRRRSRGRRGRRFYSPSLPKLDQELMSPMVKMSDLEIRSLSSQQKHEEDMWQVDKATQSFPFSPEQGGMRNSALQPRESPRWFLAGKYFMYLFNIMQMQIYAPQQSDQWPVFPRRSYQYTLQSDFILQAMWAWACRRGCLCAGMIHCVCVCDSEWKVTECACGGGYSFWLWCLALM